VIITPHGYHIFKITSKENPGFYRLDEIKVKLKEALSRQKEKQTISDWVDNQRQKATIVVSPQLQTLFANNKLEIREDIVLNKPTWRRTQISGQGQHF
jgi:parvulin-like peptidyl-prolyl isomerase